MFILDGRPCTFAGLQRSARAYFMATSSAAGFPEPTTTRTSPASPSSVTSTLRITRTDFPGSMPASAAYGAVSGDFIASVGGANSFDAAELLSSSLGHASAGGRGGSVTATGSSGCDSGVGLERSPLSNRTLPTIKSAKTGEFVGVRASRQGDHSASRQIRNTWMSRIAVHTKAFRERVAPFRLGGGASGGCHSSTTISELREFMSRDARAPITFNQASKANVLRRR